ncbi:hypothetical protein ACFL1O_00345 [Patescibacteria group bacterium]
MREFQERRILRNIFFSRPVFVLFLCLVVLLAYSVFGVYKKSKYANFKNEIVEKEVSELKQRLEFIDANIGRLSTEAGMEEELRKKFQIKKPGEDYVVILAPTPEGVGVPTSSETSVGKNLFEKFLNFFR